MLPRAARRRNPLHQLRLSTEQLTLPWLCPAALRAHTQSHRPGNNDSKLAPTTSTLHRRSSFSQSRRYLATATDGVPLSSSASPTPSWLSPLLGQTLYSEPAIMIQESQLITTPTLKRVRGIGGSLEEMMARFHVLLQTREIEKAAQVLDRMSAAFAHGDLRFLDLHNQYIEAVVGDMIENKRTGDTLKKALSLQTWFEVKLPQGFLKPNARTMAIMLRMTLRLFHGSRRDRTVRRYWNMVKQNKFEVEVLSMPDLLTERDLGEISQLCPNELPNFDLIIEDEPEFVAEETPTHKDTSVRATKQKGLGLSSLKSTLSVLPDFDNAIEIEDLESEEAKKLQRKRQAELEGKAVDTAKKRWQREMETMRSAGIDTSGGGKTIASLLEQWYNDLVIKVKEEINTFGSSEKSSKLSPDDKTREYADFLRLLPPDTLAAITVMHIIQLFARAGVEKGLKVPTIMTSLGQEVQNEFIAQSMIAKSERDSRHQKFIKQVVENRKKKAGRIKFKKLLTEMKCDSRQIDSELNWPIDVHAKVGGALLSLLFDCAKTPVVQEDPETKKRITIMEPAFQHSYEINRGRKFGLLHAHPEVTRRLIREAPNAVHARHMPMLSEPQPWTGFDKGGFLAQRSSIIRTTPGDTLQQSYMKKALEKDGLPEVRAGLDILGKTAWTINNDVFDVMLEAWNTGEAFPKIPPLDPKIPMPEKPADDDIEAMKVYNNKLREAENLRSGLHSQRCFINFQMEIARAYKNQTFYLPHNMDFRGRAYPLPAYLNQMSADNARSLLLFKKGKALGEAGLRWLKIHLSNVYGFDKASLQEREEFTMKHLDDVLDSANKGLHGRKWFMEAEDPWQCLAACCELRNALQLESPAEYMSRLPVHQDGSCNGLQHYAALGGDMEGAQHVNLEPGDRPKDIYTGVSDYVTEKVARDAAAGHEIAKLLEGKIKRKIVKQTVMTNVYGVTFVGAIRQVRRQIAAHYPGLEEVPGISKYIASAIFEALSTIFSGAHSIQYWLGDCATRISQSISPDQLDLLAKHVLQANPSVKDDAETDPLKMFRSTIIWTTPLGLPVVQPYRAVKCQRVYTTLQTLNIIQNSTSGSVSKRKQLQAFPPNFIHSLDATHMMLSAIECYRQGLVFSAVHDSFWTHACDVDKMNIALRDCFIRMHSDDIIKRLAAEFRARYQGHIFLAKIPESSPVAQAIAKYRKERYGNSKRKYYVDELLMEHQRQTLLRSDAPELQEKGRAMVTAASIFERVGGSHNDLAIASTLGQTGTGNITSEKRAGVFGNAVVDDKDPAVASLFSDLDPQYLDAEIDAKSREDVVGEESGDATQAEEPKMVEDEVEGKPKSTKTKYKMEWAWLPLQFRDIPKKGEFDVRRLKDSQPDPCLLSPLVTNGALRTRPSWTFGRRNKQCPCWTEAWSRGKLPVIYPAGDFSVTLVFLARAAVAPWRSESHSRLGLLDLLDLLDLSREGIGRSLAPFSVALTDLQAVETTPRHVFRLPMTIQ
uniref:DNA-directed RNA polymerase n=1 Tax=Talaromyces marneffei PM1 TaxID=1077442 RepID=A0A093USB6_TALMA